MEAVYLVCTLCAPKDEEGAYTTNAENSFKLGDWGPAAGYSLMAPFRDDLADRADELEKFFEKHRHNDDGRQLAVKHNFDVVYETEESNGEANTAGTETAV